MQHALRMCDGSVVSDAENKPVDALIVDDDPTWRLLIRKFTEQSSVATNLIEAASLQEAEQIIAEKSIDCAFFDLSLPDAWPQATMDFCDRISHKFPIVILSSSRIDIQLGIKTLPSIYLQIVKTDINFEDFDLVYQFASRERSIIRERN